MIPSEEMVKRRTRRAKMLKVVSYLIRITPSIIRGITMIGLAMMLAILSPYITGDKVFDEETLWTQSQLMGGVLFTLILWLLGFVGRGKL